MKKIFSMGFLAVLIFFSAGNPRDGLAIPAAIPAITFQINGPFTFASGGNSGYWSNLGELVTFTVPFPAKCTILSWIQGGPPGMKFGVHFFPAGPCSEGQVWVAGHCFPEEIQASIVDFIISRETLQALGQTWKARPMVRYDGNGNFNLHGQINVTFQQIPEFAPIRIVSPVANAVFQVNSNIHIVWTNEGKRGANVKILLVPEANPQAAQVIVASTANNGAYTWRPAAGFTGKVRLEIQSLDGKILGKSGMFTIHH